MVRPAVLLGAVCLLLLSSPLLVSAANPVLVASYLPTSSRAHLQSLFAEQSEPCSPQRSDAHVVQPAAFGVAGAAMGDSLRVRLLAFARDEVMQTALVSIGATGAPLDHHSHLSLALTRSDDAATGGVEAYAAGLWLRLEKAGFVHLARDASNPQRILSVRLTPPTDPSAPPADDPSSFATLLPPLMGREASMVAVRLIDNATETISNLQALVCPATRYNADTHSCLSGSEDDEARRAFVSTSVAASLRRLLVQDVCALPGWDVTPFADHSTIEYIADPASRDPGVYNRSLGSVQRFALRAYARDEHSSSVLLSLEDERDATGRPSGPTHSRNKFVHITLSAMEDVPEGAYGPAYSNVLWTRLENASLVFVQRDDEGHITGATLAGEGSELRARLPPFGGDYRVPWGEHAATEVYVRVMDGTEGFDSVVCTSDYWQPEQRRCVLPPMLDRAEVDEPAPAAEAETETATETGSIVTPAAESLSDVDDGSRQPGGLGEGGRVGVGIACGVLFTLALVLCCVWGRKRAQRWEAERAQAEQMFNASNEPSVSVVHAAGFSTPGASTPGTPRRSQHKRQPSRLPYLPPTLRLNGWEQQRSIN